MTISVLERFSLNKYICKHEFNIICNTGIKNNFDLKTVINNILRKIRKKLKYPTNSNNNIINCPMK